MLKNIRRWYSFVSFLPLNLLIVLRVTQLHVQRRKLVYIMEERTTTTIGLNDKNDGHREKLTRGVITWHLLLVSLHRRRRWLPIIIMSFGSSENLCWLNLMKNRRGIDEIRNYYTRVELSFYNLCLFEILITKDFQFKDLCLP